MQTFLDIIALWPSQTDLGRDLGVPYGVVKQWRLRNSIPAERWTELVAASEARGYGVSLDLLAELARRRAAA